MENENLNNAVDAERALDAQEGNANQRVLSREERAALNRQESGTRIEELETAGYYLQALIGKALLKNSDSKAIEKVLTVNRKKELNNETVAFLHTTARLIAANDKTESVNIQDELVRVGDYEVPACDGLKELCCFANKVGLTTDTLKRDIFITDRDVIEWNDEVLMNPREYKSWIGNYDSWTSDKSVFGKLGTTSITKEGRTLSSFGTVFDSRGKLQELNIDKSSNVSASALTEILGITYQVEGFGIPCLLTSEARILDWIKSPTKGQ